MKRLIHLFLKFADSKIGLMFIGFVLTTFLGTSINYLYQTSTWRRTQQFEVLKRSLDKHDKLVDSLAELMSSRAYRLERFFWALESLVDKPGPLTEKALQKIEKRRKEYYDEVISWNEKFRVEYSRLLYLTDKKTANKFYVSEEESKKVDTKTVYGYFRTAHNGTVELYNCFLQEPRCQDAKYLSEKTAAEQNRLYKELEDFLKVLHKSRKKYSWEYTE